MSKTGYEKEIRRKTLLSGLVLFLFSLNTFSQGMTAQQQLKVDSLLQWINLQQVNGKPIDQHHIDSVNQVIRAMNVPVKKSDTSSVSKKDGVNMIEKQGMVGTSFTVPENTIWLVKRVYCNDGGSYNVLVTSIKYDKPLMAGEKIFVPTWSAESELLNKKSTTFNYIFKIEEFTSKK